MSFSYTEEQILYRRLVRGWMERNVALLDPVKNYDPDHPEFLACTKQWERKLYEAGYLGVNWPSEYGGHGRSIVEQYIVQDELGRAGAPESITVPGRELVGPILIAAGTEHQKMRYLGGMLRGEDVWCQGFSEPGAGSDLAAVKTRAVRDGDDWVVSGQKVWTSQAHFSNMCILLARTDPAVAKHKGLSLFLLDMHLPGIEVRPIRQITGHSEFNEVFFDNVRLPGDSLLGPANQGWGIAVDVLAIERAVTRFDRSARYFRRFEKLLAFCNSPRSGKALIEQSHIQKALAELFGQLLLTKYCNIKSVRQIQSGLKIGPEFSIRKLIWSEAHQRLCELELEVEQECDDFPGIPAIENYLYSRGDTIFAGTTQIQKDIIADRVLQMQR